MSGIFGFQSYDKNQREVDASRCLWLQEKYNHKYGNLPPRITMISGGGIGCVSDTLSSDSMSSNSGNTFVSNTDYGTIAVFDVLLYHRDHLLERLLRSDILIDMSCSDEELLLQWINTYGLDALSEVNGDFAGAIYQDGIWTLFRDHMGIRPLYYYTTSNVFIFSTDLLGITQLPSVDNRIDEKQFYLHLINGNYLSEEATEYEKIKCIKPGSYYQFHHDEHGFVKTEHCYWQPGTQKLRKNTAEEYLTEFRSLIEDAVKCRAEVLPEPIGADLSGGLDSGIIALLLSHMGKDVRFGSWSSPIEELALVEEDERLVIQDICQSENRSCFFLSDSDRVLEYSDEELIPPFINTVAISCTAKKMQEQGVRTIFSGHGGDEGVSHRCNTVELCYHREYLACLRELYQKVGPCKLHLLRTIIQLWKLKKHTEEISQAIMGDADGIARYLNPVYLEQMKHDYEEKPFLFGIDPVEHIRQGAERPRLDNLAYQGARYGIRYLVPYLDYRVIDYAISIPRHLYYKNQTNRYIFRKAFEDLMPDSLKRVNYKDTPSLRNHSSSDDTSDVLRESLFDVLSRVSKNHWSRIFDFDQIEDTYLNESAIFTDAQLVIGWELVSSLERCARIQKLQEAQER